jgi:hypothetical protein
VEASFLYTCPHTPTCVSSYSCIRVLIGALPPTLHQEGNAQKKSSSLLYMPSYSCVCVCICVLCLCVCIIYTYIGALPANTCVCVCVCVCVSVSVSVSVSVCVCVSVSVSVCVGALPSTLHVPQEEY